MKTDNEKIYEFAKIMEDISVEMKATTGYLAYREHIGNGKIRDFAWVTNSKKIVNVKKHTTADKVAHEVFGLPNGETSEKFRETVNTWWFNGKNKFTGKIRKAKVAS